LNDACRHVALIDVSKYPTDTEVPCTVCGIQSERRTSKQRGAERDSVLGRMAGFDEDTRASTSFGVF
jgi:hypothetical protein